MNLELPAHRLQAAIQGRCPYHLPGRVFSADKGGTLWSISNGMS